MLKKLRTAATAFPREVELFLRGFSFSQRWLWTNEVFFTLEDGQSQFLWVVCEYLPV